MLALPMDPARLALELAHEAGFDLAGLAPYRAAQAAPRYGEWLDAGHHASMDYLERARSAIEDPALHAPEGRTLLVVGLAHGRPPVELPGGGRVARYAAGPDYHNHLLKRLRRLARRLRAEGLVGGARSSTDRVPLMERSHAAEAGLGFESKAANLLHPRFGPWFFLGELVLDRELEPTAAELPAGSCGTCTACLDACPTGALLEPGVLDAGRCLSWSTIEHRGATPHALREAQGDWVFGCDVCSEVCPWGHGGPDRSGLLGTHPRVAEGDLVSWLELPREPHGFEDAFVGTPLRRPGREGLAANAALVLGNRPREEGRVALLRVLREDPSPRVREAALWGLARGHGQDAGVSDALGVALGREPDAGAAALMRATLEGREPGPDPS